MYIWHTSNNFWRQFSIQEKSDEVGLKPTLKSQVMTPQLQGAKLNKAIANHFLAPSTTKPLAMAVDTFLPRASHCSQTSSMSTSLSASGFCGWNLQDSPQRRDFLLVKPWAPPTRSFSKGCHFFHLLLGTLVQPQACFVLHSHPGTRLFTSSGAENASGRASRAPLVSWGWLCCSVGLTKALQEDPETQTHSDATERESVHRQFTEKSPELTSVNSSYAWGAVRPQNNWVSATKSQT